MMHQRFCGPTRSIPPLSIQAIEPPPAPIVRMSIIGIWIGKPHSISKPVVKLSWPPTMVEQSVEVPPMSIVTSDPMPSSFAMYLPATTPPVGPDTVMWIGELAAASSVISPPFDLMTATFSVTPFAANFRFISRS
jgi:hypothetical protein